VVADAAAKETAMRQKASTIGNIVHESVPVSNTEVRLLPFPCFPSLLTASSVAQDDNAVIRTFFPKDGNGEQHPPVKGGALTMKEGILSHHEVMARLDILEMERGAFSLSSSSDLPC
jgi:seryl-tRNA synthetase